MTRIVECPACESDFAIQLSQELDGICQCPYCQREFEQHKLSPRIATVVTTELPTTVPRLLRVQRDGVQPPPMNRSAAGDDSPSEGSNDHRNGQLTDTVIEDDLSTVRAGDLTAAKRWVSFLIVSAIVVVLLAATVLYWQFAPKRREIVSPSAASNGSADVPPIDTTHSAEGQEAERTDSEKTTTAPPDDLERLQFLSNDKYLQLWGRVYPYLVELEVQTPSETRRVAGVIVDSRGWVATSWHAVHDARTIRVTVAGKTFNSDSDPDSLSDECRGLLASDAAHDLALLEINRRLVSAYKNVELDVDDQVFIGSHLIGAAPPKPGSRVWFFDCPVRKVDSFERLPDEVQAVVSERQLDASHEMAWLAHAGDLRWVQPGSPLFSDQGVLMGLATGYVGGELGLAVTGRSIQRLTDAAQERAHPFPLADVANAKVSSEVPVNRSAPTPEPPGLRSLSEQIDRVKAIQLFSDSAEDYQVVCEFARTLIDLDDSLTRQGAGHDDPTSVALDRELDGFQAHVDDVWPGMQYNAGGFNQLAWHQTEQDGNPFVATAEVNKVGLTAPILNGQHSVVFELSQTDHYLITQIQEHEEVFLPGSRWLIVGTSLSNLSDWKATEPKPFSARRCRVLRVFSLNSPN